MTFGEGQQVCGADRSDDDDDEKHKIHNIQKLPLLPTSPEGAHKRPPMQGVLAAGRQNKAAGPTRSRSMPSTRGFLVALWHILSC